MIQARRSAAAPTRRYEDSALVRAEQELEAARRQIAAVRRWAVSGEWAESGSDGLYAALEEK